MMQNIVAKSALFWCGERWHLHNSIPRTKYVRGILWFSRRYAASATASADIHRSHDCFHILYVDWYRWEDSWEARWTGPIIYGPPRAPQIPKNAHFCILWPIYEKLAVIFFPCMSALLWGLTALKFSFTWVRHKGPQDPPNMKKKINYFLTWLFPYLTCT